MDISKGEIVLICVHTGPALMAHSIRLWIKTLGSSPGSDTCHLIFDICCAYTVLQTTQRPGVCSAIYGTVHYNKK